MSLALIALGSNLGDRTATLAAAIDALRREPAISVVRVSSWMETAPVGGPPGQGAFLNGALVAETDLTPETLLARMLAIENELGRVRDVRWGPRTIDLDLLLYDDLVVRSPTLVLPHPELLRRRFALEPACQVAGAWRHPQTGRTLAEHLSDLPDD